MIEEEYKVIQVNLPTYGYLMDRKSSELDSVEAVIWNMVSEIEAQKKRINELEAAIKND